MRLQGWLEREDHFEDLKTLYEDKIKRLTSKYKKAIQKYKK